MPIKFIAALVVAAASGCRMCSDSCDYSPPVAGSPYGGVYGRAGSAFSGEMLSTLPPTPPEPVATGTSATEPPMAP